MGRFLSKWTYSLARAVKRPHNHDVIRLYVDEWFEVGSVVTPPAEELRYLRTVRRGGAQAELFNRAGQVAQVTFEGNSARIDSVIQSPWPVHPLRVAVGAPEPAVVKRLIASLSELGVAELLFFKADRSQAGLARLPSDDKLNRLTIEAARQCERPQPLKVSVIEFDALLEQFSTGRAIVFDEHPEAGEAIVDQKVELLVVGPEGGWSPQEREAFATVSAPALHLPTPILRVSTAAIAGTVWCLAHRSMA